MDKNGQILGQDGLMYIKSSLSGYHENGYWDDRAGGQVKHIVVCYEPGCPVRSIQTTYERDGALVMSRRHGGNRGNIEMVNLKEPLTWISGHYGSWCIEPDVFFSNEEDSPWNYIKVIKSLKFGTNQDSYGPFGTEEGEHFQFRASGTEIGGFFGYGSKDSYINGIGVYIRCPAVRFIDDEPNVQSLPGGSVKVEQA